MTLSHLGAAGRPRMVDVGHKDVTTRRAVAEGLMRMSPEAYRLIEQHAGPKGDVRSVAELAGVMGAKQTAALIPLCHPVPLDHVEVSLDLVEGLPGLRAVARARTAARTGVEMEALTAVAVALLTAYDMLKSAGHDLEIVGIRLLEKTGGASGDWTREDR